MKKRILLITFILSCSVAFAQQKITGQVVNTQTLDPVPFATIKEKYSAIETSTNIDGYFNLTIKHLPDTLQITAIGFENLSLPLSGLGSKALMIKLIPSTKQLQEVLVSTGYQVLPKERSTGSFTQLNNNLLNQQVSTDIISRLESVTNGLFFDRSTSATPQIEIRGLSTINGPTAPLIVVDNFPYEGNITNINPNDVESVTILKDAAAASIWGTRAGNGVIVITTKKAKFNQPVTITFNANLSIGEKPDLSYLHQMSSGDYINVEEQLFKNGFYDSKITDPTHPPLTPVVELLNAARNGTISAADANYQINSFRGLDVRNDFDKYFYQQSKNQQYAFSVNGGSDNQSWLFSTGYDKDVSNLAADYSRINLHFQDNFKPLKNLLLSVGAYYTQTTNVSGKPGYGDVFTSAFGMYPYAQFADAKGNALPVAKDYSLSYLGTLPSGFLDWKYYPLTDYQNTITKATGLDLVANFAATYKLFSFLSFNAQYQYERQSVNTNMNDGVDSYYARNLINSFTQNDGLGDVTNIVPVGGILTLADQQIETQNFRGQFNVDKSWGKNEFNAIAGGEIRQVNTFGNTNSFYGYNPNTLTFGNVDLTNVYPDYVSGNYNFIPDTKSLSNLSNHFVSVFLNAAYTYNDKYTLSLSGRRDASNLFGVNTNNKWNPLGSVGLAWNVSNEKFYKSDVLSLLRLRATYGLSGNVDLSQTAVSTIEYLNNSPYTQTPQAIFNTYANPDLKWETVAMLNLAVDFAVFNKRISGTVEYYHKKATDLFGLTPVDYTSGIPFDIVKNVASMEGNGLDINLRSLNTNGKFKWQTTLNVSFYNDKVTAYYLGDDIPGYSYINQNSFVSGVVGKPVYAVFSFKSAGLDPANGNPRGYLNGQISENYDALYYNSSLGDLKYNGSALPTSFGSFLNSFSYHNFSLDINLSYKLGYYFRKFSIDYSGLFNNGIGNADYAQRWQKPGDEQHTYVPSMVYPDNASRDAFYLGSDPLVENGDHVRLQYITLSYDLLKTNFSWLPVKSVKLYSNISNIGIIWAANKDHIDPDYYYTPNTLKPPLTIAFGIKSSF
jgi:TonB-linked SusC/RagA family outer membrane protein